MRSPCMRELVKDHSLFPCQAVDRADVDLAARANGTVLPIVATAGSPAGVAVDGDRRQFEAGVGEQACRSDDRVALAG